MPARPHSLLRTTALLALLVALLATLLVSGTAATAEAATNGSKVVAEASKHRGKPYKYGAAGPSRFDCSGFTKYVYSRFGKRLPHSSAQQYRVSRKVAKSAKQVGDLIFTRNSSGRIGHVGIYAGSGKFWVSPKTGDVVKLQRIYTSNYVVGRP
jgi:cell wall-associated NlpC family hydrolase